jgi:hypothetical protein
MTNPHPVSRRKPGVPNKASSARIGRALADGRKLPPEELLRNAEDCRAMVALYAPSRMNMDTGLREANPRHNEDDYDRWLAAERDALKAAAPYYAPRLMAVAVKSMQDVAEQDHADPRQVMWEIYKTMRERGEIGLKALAPPPAKTNGGCHAIEATVVKEDNGDGEAA